MPLKFALLLASATSAMALFSQGTISDRDYSIQVDVGNLNYHHQLDCVVSQRNPLYAYCGGKYKTDGDESGSGESYDFTTEICPAMKGCSIVEQPKNATAQYSEGAGMDVASSTVASSAASTAASTAAKDASSSAATATSAGKATTTGASSSSSLATAEDKSTSSSADAEVITSTSSISSAALATTDAVETLTSTSDSSSPSSSGGSDSASASASSSTESSGAMKAGVSALMVAVGFVGVVGMI
ncbi:hypothetical protein BCR35DRAFT_354516 [Leucosporidium creatinivorum]|uniref:Uncharacterized protein n=1 Tax=Leucosporidium creatinivorum TaxID=106004 RepID=A0A1Y2EHI6_9BASI|nr:hypothetical protein BCR35DRAFT_354516 [Leucosporidium creatinivorum]